MSIQTPRRVQRRIPPRRRRPKRSVFRSYVLPLLKVAVIVVAVVAVGGVVLAKIARPFQLWSREDREVQRIASELDALKKENADLQRQIKYLGTPQGIAQAARRLGWVKPGEITLVLPDPRATESREVE